MDSTEKQQQADLFAKSVKIALVVATYWCHVHIILFCLTGSRVVSISMVFLNKYLLSGIDVRDPAHSNKIV